MQHLTTHQVLFEIGVEELPPHTLKPLSEQLLEKTAQLLYEKKIIHLNFQETKTNEVKNQFIIEKIAQNIKTFASPRRIGMIINGIQPKQDEQQIQKLGPYCHLPQVSKIKFAESLNLDPKNLEKINTPKGERWKANIKTIGKKAEQLLPEIIKQAVLSLVFQKPMRWAQGNLAFIRPVHWVVLMMDESIIPFNLFNLHADHLTYGHRFYHQEPISVTPKTYENELQKHHVIACREKRKQQIQDMIHQAITALKTKSKDTKILPLTDHHLIEEITDINEKPNVYLGQFDASFLNLPEALLSTVMIKHQRYIPLKQKNKLLNQFIFFSNIKPKNPKQMIFDNEKVLQARFSDAQFFFEQDQKISLENRLLSLKNLQFAQNLGSYFDKTKRIEAIITHLFDDATQQQTAKRASLLCQCDLTTDIVAEFPELCGIIGSYYAKICGENEQIIKAISQQYLPKTIEDQLPETEIGAKLSVAHKIDHFFQLTQIANQWPSSTKDPFGTRRHALGLIKLLLLSPYLSNLSIEHLLNITAKAIDYPIKNIQWKKIKEFFVERLKNYLKTQLPNEIIMAILNTDSALKKPLNQMLEVAHAIEIYQANEPEKLFVIQQSQKRLKNILKHQSAFDQKIKFTDLTHSIEHEIQAQLKTFEHNQPISIKINQLYTLAQKIEKWFEQTKITQGSSDEIATRFQLIQKLIDQFEKISAFEYIKIPKNT